MDNNLIESNSAELSEAGATTLREHGFIHRCFNFAKRERRSLDSFTVWDKKRLCQAVQHTKLWPEPGDVAGPD